jgi:hypothetical protein
MSRNGFYAVSAPGLLRSAGRGCQLAGLLHESIGQQALSELIPGGLDQTLLR